MTASPEAPPRTARIALVGNSNVGKSTLFNQISGARQRVGNWAGTTVEVSQATWSLPIADGTRRPATVIDLPGAASLNPQSPDEQLTHDVVVDPDPSTRPDLLLAVVDASSLGRCLYLVAHLREMAHRVVVVVTKADIAARRDVRIDTDHLTHAVGAPVVVVDPRRRGDLDRLAALVSATLDAPVPQPRAHAEPSADDPFAVDDDRFTWVNNAMQCMQATGKARATFSDRFDRVATAPVVGPLLFLGVMWLVFQTTTVVAAPVQDWLDAFFAGPVSAAVVTALGWVGLAGGWVEGLVVDGLIAGVGTLLTFVPLMALMFLLLALLENSGYTARAAVVTERAMRAIGLPGRAFLPLIVGFGCNVPAISAARILPDSRQRIMTALLVPFTACGARLPVFVMLAAVFFPANAGNVVFGMYLASVALVIGIGLLLRKTLWRTMGAEPMVIDLPAYTLPLPRQVLQLLWTKVAAFLRTAGGIIVVAVVAVWALSSIPAPGADGSVGDVAIEDSVFAATANAISPVFEPAGFGDWHTTGALIAGFVAKEAVISSWAQTYAAGEPADPADPGLLGNQVYLDFEASSGGHTTAAVLAFLVFLLAYVPCVATLGEQRREIGTRWMLASVGISLTTAYVLAVAVFQIGRVLS